jgi:hypothetical protein
MGQNGAEAALCTPATPVARCSLGALATPATLVTPSPSCQPLQLLLAGWQTGASTLLDPAQVAPVPAMADGGLRGHKAVWARSTEPCPSTIFLLLPSPLPLRWVSALVFGRLSVSLYFAWAPGWRSARPFFNLESRLRQPQKPSE